MLELFAPRRHRPDLETRTTLLLIRNRFGGGGPAPLFLRAYAGFCFLLCLLFLIRLR